MLLIRILTHPLRVVRDLPIAWKLAGTSLGAMALLALVSWVGLDRLAAVGRLQDGVARRSADERQIQRSLVAALELRVISRELLYLQAVPAVKAATERAEQRRAESADLLHQAADRADAAADRALLTQALQRLDQMADAVKNVAALRTDMLISRQKRLFQVRPLFDASLHSLMEDIARGSAALSGVDSVRDGAVQATVDQHDPAIEAISNYRLAMVRLQGAALMFMATGNGGAANEVRDAVADAERAMAAILGGAEPDSVKADARTAQAIGTGMAQVAVEMIGQSRKLDAMVQKEVESASTEMQAAIGSVVQSFTARVQAAAATAAKAEVTAQHEMLLLLGGIAMLLVSLGTVTTQVISRPMRGLVRTLRAIAAGETDAAVGYVGWRDEVGQMAEAVETLRGVMRQTFVQSQMIEQIPIGVMTAEATGDHRITFLNAETKRLMALVEAHLPVKADQVLGASFDVFRTDPGRPRDVVSDEANLPHRSRIRLGEETLEVAVTAIHDRHGAYAGPMVLWRRLTDQVQLATQFEHTVGAIARSVGEAAGAMTATAQTMTEAAEEAGQRTRAVATAADQASVHVGAAAAGAEELAVSVGEIGRQVEESARIAGQAVREADATDHSVSGLSEAAGRIGDVVRLIGDIAGRTNLLALNATIEAARAGEAGKGFAVVASEVKNLANQTAKATDEIAAQIGGMQQAAEQAATALRSITATIQRMNEIATAIAGAVEEQGAATHEIAGAVQRAASGTSEVNSNIAVVSQSVDDTGTQAGAVLQAATRLSEQSNVLKTEVQDFLESIQKAA
ncbi:MAG: methyl-accepting chemotaxis protein [Acetobacteraceae bacterium]|nr:methyl-accepting chemotaxis protein [Acetobacteraceae bacterium]